MGGAERNEMVTISFLGMAVLYAALQLIRDRKALTAGFRMERKPLLYLLLSCVSATAAAHMMLWVLTMVDASVLYTIDNGAGLLFSVLYSRLLFKEKLAPAQLAGVALAAASIVMLSI